MNVNFDWTNGIVAIYDGRSRSVGTGFVVSEEGLIATCAHVLDQAGWPFEDWDAPVQIRFKATGRYAEAFVQEICFKGQTEDDLAILVLKDPLPTGVEVLQLAAAGGADGHRVRMWGYPEYGREGLRGSGQVEGLIPGPWGQQIQIESTNTTTGYSGGPVWDEDWGRVIGMILAGLDVDDVLGRHQYTTLAIPAETLVDLCPGRLALTPPVELLSEEHQLALEAYLSMIASQGNRLPLAPLDPVGKDSAYISLSQVYVNLDAGEVELPGDEPDKVIRYSAAIGHIQENDRLILLGDPGSGKTTLLRFVSFCLAQAQLATDVKWLERLNWKQHVYRVEHESEKVELASGRVTEIRGRTDLESQEQLRRWPADPLLPIYVTLRDIVLDLNDSDLTLTIWNHVAKGLELSGLPEAVEPLRCRALAGQVIFLLDGVDEVPSSERPAIWQAIAALARGPYGRCRWVATCRVLSYVKDETPVGVAVQTLQQLNESQIEAFIAGWYGALAEAGELDQEQAGHLGAALQAASRRPELRPLAHNPMLLTIMALVQTYHGALPDERAKLYQDCVETLLLRWQRHKERTAEGGLLPDPLVQLGVKQEDLERLLWEIAWKAHSEAEGRDGAADIPRMQVVELADEHLGSLDKAAAFLEYTERRAHLLIGKGGKGERVYAFPHRTFQEYLAACHLASSRRFPRKAARLAEESATWRETLNLATGTLVFNQNNREKALDGVEGVLPEQVPTTDDEAGWNRVWLAGEMMAVIGRAAAEQDEVGREVLPRLREQLVALLEGGRLAPISRAEAGDALGRIGDPRPGVCTRLPDMIDIPEGTFLMGSDPDKDSDATEFEQPQHEVELPAFAIARYPVTNAQFRFFVEDGGYTEKWRDCWTTAGWERRQRYDWIAPRYWDDAVRSIDNKPIIGVSWYEAVAYANWLSCIEGLRISLPSEAQWERAARDTDGCKYPWGDAWAEGVVNTQEAGVGRTTVVGSFPGGAAACGALDMSGNVWEWTSSLVASYPYDAGDGREDPSARGARALRGGAFNSFPRHVRASSRYHYFSNPHDRHDTVGIRLVAPAVSGS